MTIVLTAYPGSLSTTVSTFCPVVALHRHHSPEYRQGARKMHRSAAVGPAPAETRAPWTHTARLRCGVMEERHRLDNLARGLYVDPSAVRPRHRHDPHQQCARRGSNPRPSP